MKIPGYRQLRMPDSRLRRSVKLHAVYREIWKNYRSLVRAKPYDALIAAPRLRRTGQKRLGWPDGGKRFVNEKAKT